MFAYAHGTILGLVIVVCMFEATVQPIVQRYVEKPTQRCRHPSFLRMALLRNVQARVYHDA
jgi:hypothetical protein